MPSPIRPLRVNHFNVVVEDFDASVAHLQTLFDAEFLVDMPQREWHACLVAVGRVIFELFVPHEFLLNARYGPHYVGIEYQADLAEVRRAIADHGIRIVRDIGIALHTHPADCFGIAFEFYDGSFHERDWPTLGGPMKPAEHWRDGHPLGLTGLKAYTVAVHDLAAARAFFESFLGADTVYEALRPAIAAQALGLRVADSVVELVTPTGDGPLRTHLHRFGEGIRSVVFGVCDIQQAQRYFSDRQVATVPGATRNSLAIPAQANLGLLFEFSA